MKRPVVGSLSLALLEDPIPDIVLVYWGGRGDIFLQFSCQQEGYEGQEEVEKGLLPRGKIIEV